MTVPEFCFSASNPNPAPKANFHSTSEDSSSDVSSISYTTSAGSSSPDISFMKPASVVSKEEPTQLFHNQVCKGQEAEYHRLCPQNLRSGPGFFPATEHVPSSHLTAGRELCHGRPSFLSGNSGHFAYKEEAVPVRFHRSVVSHSRVLRTPSLKDFVPVGPRVLSKAAVTEELKSWHERTRLRNARPHSLDRQGAFRVRSMPGRELHSPCSLGYQIQVRIQSSSLGRRSSIFLILSVLPQPGSFPTARMVNKWVRLASVVELLKIHSRTTCGFSTRGLDHLDTQEKTTKLK